MIYSFYRVYIVANGAFKKLAKTESTSTFLKLCMREKVMPPAYKFKKKFQRLNDKAVAIIHSAMMLLCLVNLS